MFRIVAEKRGDAVMGFRVQVMSRSRRRSESGDFAEYVQAWRNKGRRVYTVADAENLRVFFESEHAPALPQVTYEEIQSTDMPRGYRM